MQGCLFCEPNDDMYIKTCCILHVYNQHCRMVDSPSPPPPPVSHALNTRHWPLWFRQSGLRQHDHSDLHDFCSAVAQVRTSTLSLPLQTWKIQTSLPHLQTTNSFFPPSNSDVTAILFYSDIAFLSFFYIFNQRERSARHEARNRR